MLLLARASAYAQLPADSIRAIIKQEIAAKRSRSIIVGIIDAKGKQVIAEGKLSDTDPRTPDASTVYEIGSITKVFTTLLLADMTLKKEVNLSDPISTYLPKTITAPVRNGKQISLLSLATHRSGLPRNATNIDSKDPDNPFADYDRPDLYEYLSSATLNRDIDSRWQYSNIGYALLGDILSTAGHMPFDTLVLRDICRPLKLNHTFFKRPSSLKLTEAKGYTEYGRSTSHWDFPLAGGGGLRSDLNDMLRFAAANLGLVKTDLLPAMELSHQKQAKKDGNDGYVTLGWTLWDDHDRQILFKDGGTGGYRSFIGLDKKKGYGVVVLSNANNIVTDIGLHILDSTYAIKPYKYPWALFDTIRDVAIAKGAAAAIQLYHRLKDSKDSMLIFNEQQLNYTGDELRRAKKQTDAIAIYEFAISEYPKSPLAYENLAELYKCIGNKKQAIAYFRKLHELEPEHIHWSYMLKKLGAN